MADEEILQDGTEEHPWLVANYSELKALYSKSELGQYAKLTADINCNEQCPDGWSTVNLICHLDLDGHKIIAPSVKDGNYLFYPEGSQYSSAKLYVYNGYILNLFENSSTQQSIMGSFYRYNNSAGTAIRGYYFRDMGISMYLRNACTFKTCGFQRCTVLIQGVLKTTDSFFNSIDTGSSYECEAVDSRFICKYSAIKGSSGECGRLFPIGYDKKKINRCRFEGKVDNFDLCSGTSDGAGYVNDGSIVSSIVLVETNDTYKRGYSCYNSCIISNKCKAFFSNDANCIRMDDEDIKSYEAVNNAGFITIEVT